MPGSSSQFTIEKVLDYAPAVRMIPQFVDENKPKPFSRYFKVFVVRVDHALPLPMFPGDVIVHLDNQKNEITFSIQDLQSLRSVSLVPARKYPNIARDAWPMFKDRDGQSWYLTCTPHGGIVWESEARGNERLFYQTKLGPTDSEQVMYLRALQLCLAEYGDPNAAATLAYPQHPFGDPEEAAPVKQSARGRIIHRPSRYSLSADPQPKPQTSRKPKVCFLCM